MNVQMKATLFFPVDNKKSELSLFRTGQKLHVYKQELVCTAINTVLGWRVSTKNSCPAGNGTLLGTRVLQM